jgi:glycosyltransferase involved in cell wall biosynthesis
MARPPLKVAIVHDWLVGGGAERVVYQLHRMFPDAPIYTSYCTDEWRKKLDGKVITGFLQHGPFPRLRKYCGLLRIWWFTHLDLSQYDLVISSSGNGEAKGIRVPKGTTHICYCHSPTHYYWRHYDQYMRRPGFGIFDPLARLGLRLLVGPLRRWDLKASKRPDYFIANSTHIQSDIKTYYGRESEVIFPPIDIDRFEHASPSDRHGFVVMGRLAPAKHMGLAVEACTRLNLPLKVIGDGPDYPYLKKLAGPGVTFYNRANGNRVSDTDMPAQLASSQAFIFPSFDDFGIAPVEALAAGTPLIAYKAGGALDYVQEGTTGFFFTEQTVDSLVEALQVFQRSSGFDHHAAQQAASAFSPEVFTRKLHDFIQANLSPVHDTSEMSEKQSQISSK